MTKAHILSLLLTLCITTFFSSHQASWVACPPTGGSGVEPWRKSELKPWPTREAKPKVVFVTSGNSFYTVSQTDEISHFRLIGVQVPDFSEELMADNRDAIEAKALLKRLIIGKGLHYEYDEQLYDEYGRDLVYLTTSDSIKVNQELIKSRFATHIIQPPNTRYSDLFSKLDREGAH